MSYEVHIEKYSENDIDEGELIPIKMEEWKDSISKVQSVRLSVEPVLIITEKGETISIPKKDGDVQIYFPEKSAWIHIFRWSDRGRVSFNHPLENPGLDHPVWRTAFSLAEILEAKLIGDNGEEFLID